MLAGPFSGEVTEADHSHSMWEAAFDGCLDEIRRKEGERDRHVHFPHGAALARGNALGVGRGIGREFIEPATRPSNRRDQGRAVLRSNWAGILMWRPLLETRIRGVALTVSCSTALQSRCGFDAAWNHHH